MKRPLLVFILGVCFSSCGGKSPTPSAPTPAQTTRVIALTGDLAFGSVTIGQKPTATLTITNTGNAALTVSGVTVPSVTGNVFTSSVTSGAIAAGGSQPVTIQFAPVAAITYDGLLTVNGDQTSGASTIGISGEGAGLVPLTGTVTSSAGTRITGATILVLDGPNAGRTATTSNGDDRFDNLNVGNANLSANASSYSVMSNGLFINGVNALTFTLVLVQTPPRLPLPLALLPDSYSHALPDWRHMQRWHKQLSNR